MKIEVRVCYPWAGIEDDVMIMDEKDADLSGMSENELDEYAANVANEMIYDTVSVSWSVVEE